VIGSHCALRKVGAPEGAPAFLVPYLPLFTEIEEGGFVKEFAGTEFYEVIQEQYIW
jgi:hypothetical protein